MAIKILYLITELDTGGAQKALNQLISRLDPDRYELKVVCLYNGEGRVGREIRNRGISVIDLKMTAKWRVDTFWRLYRLLRLEKPTILHSWMFHANIPGRILGRLCGVPIIVSGERTMGQESCWRYWLNRITHRFADRITCVSISVAAFCVEEMGIPQEKVVVISNGFDLDRNDRHITQQEARKALSVPVDSKLIGTVANLKPVKRIDVLLQSFSNLNEVDLIIIGDGAERKNLENLSEELGIKDRVYFAGHQEEVLTWLRALDIFVLSSEWEGLPNAILEAMAAELPVVATQVGGVPEVVINGITGYLVPPCNPKALAEKIEVLIKEPEECLKLGKAGRHRIERHYSIDQTIRKTEALYAELLEEKGFLI